MIKYWIKYFKLSYLRFFKNFFFPVQHITVKIKKEHHLDTYLKYGRDEMGEMDEMDEMDKMDEIDEFKRGR